MSSNEAESSRKRRRPNALAACDQCQSRKTRCDMVSRTTCHRCQTLGLDCLFMGKSLVEGSEAATDTSAPPREWAIIARLEQRTARLESLLTSHISDSNSTRAVPNPSDSGLEPQDPPTTQEGILDPVRDYYRAYNEGSGHPLQSSDPPSPDVRLGAYLHVSSMLALNHSPTFADPEQQGIISARDMRRMVDDFPRLVPEIFPLTQVFYTLNCSNKPMVRSCILHNLGGYSVESPPSRQTHANTALVLRNLAIIPAAEPTIDLALSLLILSLSPASRTDISLPRTPDPYEASARALRVALRLGLNKAASKLKSSGVDGMGDKMNQVVLWYAISHRSAWVDLLAADSFIARPSIAPLLCDTIPTHPPRLDLQHLWLESRLIHFIQPLSTSIAEAQCLSETDGSATTLVQPALVEFSASLSAWRQDVSAHQGLSSANWLVLHCLQIEMMAYIKVSNEFGSTTVAGSEIRRPSHSLTVELRRISLEIVLHVTTSRLLPARLPAYNLTLCFAAYALARPTSSEHQAASKDFRERLVEAHVAGERYVAYLDSRRGTTRAPSPRNDSMEGEVGDLEPELEFDPGLDISWIFDSAWTDLSVVGQNGSFF